MVCAAGLSAGGARRKYNYATCVPIPCCQASNFVNFAAMIGKPREFSPSKRGLA